MPVDALFPAFHTYIHFATNRYSTVIVEAQALLTQRLQSVAAALVGKAGSLLPLPLVVAV